MIVVSDNSPLQYLVLIQCIECLPSLYGEVLTTPQIIQELRHPKTPAPIHAWLDSTPPWLRIESPAAVEAFNNLDAGEASAISLARQRRADLLLIDERAGAQAARATGISVIGTLGVLIEAGLENLIDFDSSLNHLTLQTPFYASRTLIDAARRIYRQRSGQSPDARK
jgi:predicted nucleic acid-binding protein